MYRAQYTSYTKQGDTIHSPQNQIMQIPDLLNLCFSTQWEAAVHFEISIWNMYCTVSASDILDYIKFHFELCS